ncbi:hypothetical protein REPUB_Repub07fG0237500 [Reevesia pubescens]
MADLKQQQLSSMPQKSMYMVYRFDEGPILYTVYSFTNINFSHTPQKQSPSPIALINMRRNKVPPGMGFVALGSQLYCIGGQFQNGKNINTKFSSKKVYVVDLSTLETCCKEKKPVFVEVPDMHEGKSYPYVFEVHGKNYVLDGCRNIDVNETKDSARVASEINFEVFDPKVGEWTVLPKYDNTDTTCIGSLISGHAIVGDRVFFWYQYEVSARFKLSSFDLKNREWFYEKKSYYWRSREDKVIRDYISAWNDIFTKHKIIGSSIVVNETLYALKKGCINTFHISNNEDDRYISCDSVRGIEFEFPMKKVECDSGYHNFMYIEEVELVHFGDEKFCLVTGTNDRGNYEIEKKEIVFLTFQIVKQKSSESDDQFFCWADIYDFRVVEGIEARKGMVLCTFVA